MRTPSGLRLNELLQKDGMEIKQRMAPVESFAMRNALKHEARSREAYYAELMEHSPYAPVPAPP